VSLDIDTPVARLRPVDRSAVAIARALDQSQGPISLLVLDEPTAALPPAEVEQLYSVLQEVRAAGASILYVSHRLEEILKIGDSISVLRDGCGQGTFDAKSVSHDRLIELIVGENVATAVRDDARARHRATESAQLSESNRVEPDLAPSVFRIRGLSTGRLHGVDLDLVRGEVLGVAGLTGSGREELATALTGAAPATMTLTDPNDVAWLSLTPRRARQLGIALVLANRHPASSIREMTMGENITFARLPAYRKAGRVNLGQERSAALHWLEDLDIRPRNPERTFGLLSGGNQQKAIIARWLNTTPTLMVMDDPTSGVDVGARKAIYDIIRQRCRTGLSVVVCSSDLEDFISVCDRVVVLAGGTIVSTLKREHITEANLLAAITGAQGAS
jgi:ribose transport system ATP-binding protein